jgi:hypothetical protein
VDLVPAQHSLFRMRPGGSWCRLFGIIPLRRGHRARGPSSEARNAAAWHEQRGLADGTIRHALGAGDAAWAARLVERFFDAVTLVRGKVRPRSGGRPRGRPR